MYVLGIIESRAVAENMLKFLQQKCLLPDEGLRTIEEVVKNVDDVAASIVLAASLFLLYIGVVSQRRATDLGWIRIE